MIAEYEIKCLLLGNHCCAKYVISCAILKLEFLNFSQDSKAYYHLLEQVAPKGDEEGIPAVVIDMSGLRVRPGPGCVWRTWCCFHVGSSIALCGPDSGVP